MSTVCNDPLGIEDGRIPDEMLYASSEYNAVFAAYNARLNRPYYVWAPATVDANQYIGAHLDGVKMLSGVVLQGREQSDEWVTKFKVAYKDDTGGEWMYIMNQQEDMVGLDFSFRYHQLYLCYNMTTENKLSPKV